MNIDFTVIREGVLRYKTPLLIGLFVLLTTCALSHFLLSNPYGVLFSEMTPIDYERTIDLLERQNEPFESDEGRHTIKVKRERVDAIRMALMSDKEAFSPNVGFELFEKSDFGLTEFSQKVNYQRALQGELERTIQSIEEVRHARVQLNLPQKQLFNLDKTKASAAVTLNLHHPLKMTQVKSIQALISASVNQLSPNDVVIIDQFGNNLIHEQDTAPLQAKKKIERYLAQKVHDILKPIYPQHLVVVKVDVDLNFDEVQKDNEHPHRVAVVTHEKRSEQAALDPKKAKEKNITVEKAFQFGIEKEHFKRARGQIEHINVSVVLPKFTPKETVEEIKELVSRVVGLNSARGDKISIAALSPSYDATQKKRPAHTKDSTPIPYPLVVLGVLTLVLTGLHHYRRIRKRQAVLRDLQQWLMRLEHQHDA